MGIFNEFFKKEKPVFTGITRGIGGFGFGGGGAAEPLASLEASGGNVDGQAPGDGYKYHVFNANGTLTIDSVFDGGTLEVLLVGGGGGGKDGGDSAGGGGGGGGLVYRHSIPVSPGDSFPITIGPGGTTGDGTPSTGFSLTALGGGRGAGRASPQDANKGLPGGSGGSGSTFWPRGNGEQPTQNPGVPNLTQYGNHGWNHADSPNPNYISANHGGSSNETNRIDVGQLPAASLPFPGQAGGSTILSGAPWGPTREIALGGFYVTSSTDSNIRAANSYGCGGHGTPTSNTGGFGGVCVVRYVPTTGTPN